MVKFYETSFSHDYPFPTVTLAYFLRYPNPYSTHVLSTDILDRHYDPATQRLYTARLHLKRSKIPAPILKLLPSSILGASTADNGTSQSYILERSVVDVKEGVMITESRNLELTGVLAVVEKQVYRRPNVDLARYLRNYTPHPRFTLSPPAYTGMGKKWAEDNSRADAETDVSTKVELYSRLGLLKARAARSGTAPADGGAEAVPPTVAEDDAGGEKKMGFFRSWSTASIQRSIEAIGLRRTERAQPKSKEGMNVVLERLRTGGLKAVLDGMKRDREMLMARD